MGYGSEQLNTSIATQECPGPQYPTHQLLSCATIRGVPSLCFSFFIKLSKQRPEGVMMVPLFCTLVHILLVLSRTQQNVMPGIRDNF